MLNSFNLGSVEGQARARPGGAGTLGTVCPPVRLFSLGREEEGHGQEPGVRVHRHQLQPLEVDDADRLAGVLGLLLLAGGTGGGHTVVSPQWLGKTRPAPTTAPGWRCWPRGKTMAVRRRTVRGVARAHGRPRPGPSHPHVPRGSCIGLPFDARTPPAHAQPVATPAVWPAPGPGVRRTKLKAGGVGRGTDRHAVPGEVDAQRRLWQLRRHLLHRQAHFPGAVAVACEPGHVRGAVRGLSAGTRALPPACPPIQRRPPRRHKGTRRRTIQAQVLLVGVTLRPEGLHVWGTRRGRGAASERLPASTHQCGPREPSHAAPSVRAATRAPRRAAKSW
jgi:hypothetical protein